MNKATTANDNEVDRARSWIISAALIVTAATFIFFLASPAIGYPLDFEQALRMTEILLPVFVGYLGTASHFVFRARRPRHSGRLSANPQLFNLLLRGPVWVFATGVLVALSVFGYTNRAAATGGHGMDVDTLAKSLTGLLSLLTVTTNAGVVYLFSTGETQDEKSS